MPIFSFPWMAFTWYTPVPSPVIRDINGVIINIGDTVKIVGVIQGMNYDSTTQTGAITVLPVHPFPNMQPAVLVNSLSLISGS